jgi:hypothetical protein
MPRTAKIVPFSLNALFAGSGSKVYWAMSESLFRRGLLFIWAILMAFTGPLIAGDVVISQIYAGGGVSSSTYKTDFIELHNRGVTAVSLTGLTVQYSNGTTNFWTGTFIGGTLQPGQYYLVQQGTPASGLNDLPPPNASSSITLSAGGGKIALVSGFDTLTTSCPTGAEILDIVGYGQANCSEGLPAAALGNTTALLRGAGGCTDTDHNSTDFAISTPNPRNTSALLNACTGSQPNFLFSIYTNGFYATFSADPARSNIAEVSSNLVSWDVLSGAISNAGTFFTLRDTNTFSRRFYRIRSQ